MFGAVQCFVLLNSTTENFERLYQKLLKETSTLKLKGNWHFLVRFFLTLIYELSLWKKNFGWLQVLAVINVLYLFQYRTYCTEPNNYIKLDNCIKLIVLFLYTYVILYRNIGINSYMMAFLKALDSCHWQGFLKLEPKEIPKELFDSGVVGMMKMIPFPNSVCTRWILLPIFWNIDNIIEWTISESN